MNRGRRPASLAVGASAELPDIERLRREAAYKTRLLNTVAHELGTPMTPIRLHLHLLLQRGDFDAAAMRSLSVMARNVDRLQRLIGDVLSAARLESDRFPVRLAPTDLSKVVRDAVEDYEAAANAAGLRIEVDVAENLIVDADAERMVQVMHNLVRNAIRFTPAGKRIHVKARPFNGGAQVQVCDEGAGFDPGNDVHLFQPFTQLAAPVPGAFHGAGLGLYICRGIIELHGGTIGAASPGRGMGAVFSFQIPTGRRPSNDSVDLRERAFSDRVRSLV